MLIQVTQIESSQGSHFSVIAQDDVIFLTGTKQGLDMGALTLRSRYRGSFYQVSCILLLMTEIQFYVKDYAILYVDELSLDGVWYPMHEPFPKALGGFVIWLCDPAVQKNSRSNTACTSQLRLLLLVVFLSFHEFFLGREGQESHTGAMQPGKQLLLFLACCCAELCCLMKRGFISKEGRGVTAPFRVI